MAEIYINFWDNGVRKWILKDNKYIDNNEENTFLENLKEVTENLLGCDIKSDINNGILYIRRSSFIFYQLDINKIVTLILSDNILFVATEDSYNLKLTFISEAEAKKAQQRFLFILSGFEMKGCQDERYFDCKPSKNVGIIFN